MKRKLLTCLVLMVALGTISAQRTWTKASKSIIKSKTEALQQREVLSKTSTKAAMATRAVSKVNLADDEMLLGYIDEDEEYGALGYKEPASFECGISLTKDILGSMKGNKITTIRFALNSINYLTNVKIWITKDLTGKKVVEQSITPQVGWNEIKLETPYEVDGNDLYIGYSFKQTKVTGEKDYPIAINQTDTENGLYLSLNNQGFDNYYGAGYGSLMLQCIVQGTFAKSDVSFNDVSYNRGVISQDFVLSGLIKNNAKDEVKSIDVTYVLDGVTRQESNIELETPIKALRQGIFSIKISAPAKDGRYDIKLTIDKVNGIVDENMNNNTITADLICMTQTASRKTVVEEGTGTWCGWCVRGIVGMEKLKEKYPDNFIGIAVHWSSQQTKDPMQVDSYQPIVQMMGGFPGCVINRIYETDPYYGLSSTEFGADKAFDIFQATPSEANLSLATKYTNDSQNQIEITSTVEFNYNYDSTPYKIAYVIVEDGVTGGSQTNYYNESFYRQNIGDPNQIPADLERFKSQPSTIKGLEFNDVAVGIYDCLGIENSLEGKIDKTQPKTHTKTITLPSKIQNKENVRVVAMLIDNATGEVVNAQQVKIGESIQSGILQNSEASGFKATINLDNGVLNITANETAKVELYSANGTKVISATVNNSGTIPTTGLNGVYIVRVNNGNDVVVKKIIL